MILDKLVEKKDIQIYINLRLENLRRNHKTHNNLLADQNISNKKKRKIQRGTNKLLGRIIELEYLNHVLNGSSFRKEGKKLFRSKYNGRE